MNPSSAVVCRQSCLATRAIARVTKPPARCHLRKHCRRVPPGERLALGPVVMVARAFRPLQSAIFRR
jgi:hypothetical protein